METNRGDAKIDNNVYDRKVVIKQLIVLGIIALWLVVSAFLFSGCSDSQEPGGDLFDGITANTSCYTQNAENIKLLVFKNYL